MTHHRVRPADTIRSDISRVAPNLVDAARPLSTATLHEAAGKSGALPWPIKPTAAGFRLSGPAVTVHSPGGDNLWLLAPTLFGDVLVHPGDLIVGDGDGVVCIARDHVEQVLQTAQQREQHEADILERLKNGATTLDIYGWN
jgi:regulator of RNase E activity RraA